MSEFRRILGEAIGEASMCWSEPPNGVFESTRASEIVDRILDAFHLEAGMGVTRYFEIMQSLGKHKEIISEMMEALGNIENKLRGSVHTGPPIHVRELDGSISFERPLTIEGSAYRLSKDALAIASEKMEGLK